MVRQDTMPLVEAAKAGDRAAFSQLVEYHYSMVYGVTFSTVKNSVAAEDIAQEVFLVAWNRMGDLRQTRALPIWLRKIARNLSLNWIQSASLRRSLAERLAAQGASGAVAESDPELRVARSERIEKIREGLDSLKPKIREAIVLFYLEDQSIFEAARSLGISEGAVKMRLRRGRSLLRTHFKSNWEQRLREELADRSPESARRRIASYMAAGPALPLSSHTTSGARLGRSFHQLKHGGLSSFSNPTFGRGILLMSAKKTAVTLSVLVLAFGAILAGWTALSGSEGASEIPSIRPQYDSKTDADSRVGDEFIADAQVAPDENGAEPMAGGQDPFSDTAVLVSAAAGFGAKNRRERGKIEDPDRFPSVSGMVFDKKGNPVVGAGVLLIASGADPGETAEPRYIMQQVARDSGHYHAAVTDAFGAYLIEGIRYGGIVQLEAKAPRFIQRDRLEFNLQPGDALEQVNILLTPGVTAFGRVVSADGAPVGDALIGLLSLYRPDETLWIGSPRFTRVDEEGLFSLSATTPSIATVRVESSRFGSSSFTNVPIDDGVELELRMQAGAALSGSIRWGDGVPAKNVEVSLTGWFDFEDRPGDFSRAAQASQFSDVEGAFRFVEVDPGLHYRIQIYSRDRQPLSPLMDIGALEPGSARTWDHEIDMPIVVRGLVLGQITGQPQRDLRVSVLKDGTALPGAGVDVATDGSYEIEILSGTGEYHVYPRHQLRNLLEEGYEIGETVRLVAGEERELNLRLPDTFTMSFQVLDVAGYPVENVPIGIRDGEIFRNIDAWRTDVEGRWKWSGFRAGAESSISIFSGGHVRISSTVVIGEPGMVVPEEILVLIEYGGIEGVALDGERIPIANAIIEVVVSDADGQDQEFRLRCDEFGEFVTLDEIPATTVSLDMRIASETEQMDRPLVWRSEAFDVPVDHVVNLGALIFTSGAALNQKLATLVWREDR